MICKSCGGTFAEDATKCPYCGTMHLAGATKAYNQKFEDMTDNLANLGDAHIDAYKETIRTQTKRTLVCLGIAALAVLALAAFVGGVWYWDNHTSSTGTDALVARLAWQTEHYPLLDELYDAGDFDAILTFELALVTDDDDTNNYTLYDWSHYEFLIVYDSYTAFCDTAQGYTSGDALDATTCGAALYFYLFYHEVPTYLSLSESDIAYTEGYVAQAAAFLDAAFGLNEDDLASLQTDLADEDGWISYYDCCETMEELLA